MARIAGVNLPSHKHIVIGLTAIYGIGKKRALRLCDMTKVNPQRKVSELSETELESLREAITQYKIEGDLRREVSINIKPII